MAEPDPAALREAATHRGYRLLRSRKKTPGVGDFGKYGLTDAKGKAIIGVGEDGLTATGEEIEQYLRGGEAATWRKSASIPASSKPPKKPASPKRKAATEPETRSRPRPLKPASPKRVTRAKPKPDPKPAEPDPVPAIRLGAPGDLAGIAKLVGEIEGSGSRKGIADRVERFAREHSGFLVAERRGRIIGCLAWLVVPALHRPPTGRIATLIVTEKERRAGVGRALVNSAADALAKAGAASIEAMSDIAMRSAHGFFRRTGFEETSYRFARPVKPKPPRK